MCLPITASFPSGQKNLPMMNHTVVPCDLHNNSSPSGELYSILPFQWNQLILAKGSIDSHAKSPMWQNYEPVSWNQWESSTCQLIMCWQLSRITNSLLWTMKLTTEIIETSLLSCCYRTYQCNPLWSLCCFWSQGGAAQSSLLQFDFLDNLVPNLHFCISRVSVICLKTNHG